MPMPSLKPKVIIFPGIDGRPELRERAAAVLGNRFEVQVAALPEDLGLDYPALVQHFMERLPEGPLILAGESFSGPLVALIAERCPDRVVGVVFIASFPKLAIPRIAATLLDYVPLRAIPFGLVSWVMMGRSRNGDVTRQMRQCLSLLPDRLVKHRARLALQIDVRETIKRLRQPVLVVHGKRDRLLPLWYVERFRDLRPDAHVVTIDGYHMILETNPEQVAEALGTFADCLSYPHEHSRFS
ncbi:alpha/beta fold hydrolase [Microvirga calopogonii]|uniref:alpha/beta fold hydrolase n=1 Tax=Microvirga calopogonii TaxID=2078013 RepID=UPI000E0DB12B|nr:alpha/beta fold hydrolase [Microvirga calopogonii]